MLTPVLLLPELGKSSKIYIKKSLGDSKKRPGSKLVEIFNIINGSSTPFSYYLDWRDVEPTEHYSPQPPQHLAQQSGEFDPLKEIAEANNNKLTTLMGQATSLGAFSVHGRNKDVVVGSVVVMGKDKLFYVRDQANTDVERGMHIMEWCPETFWGTGRQWFFSTICRCKGFRIFTILCNRRRYENN